MPAKKPDEQRLPHGGEHHDEVPPNVERRLLRWVNASKIAEDFLTSPQQVRTTAGEHEAHGEGGEHPGGGHADRHHGGGAPRHARHDPWRGTKISRELAHEVIRRRPPFGYERLGNIVQIDPRLIEWIRELIRRWSGARYGEWSTPVPIDAGSGPIPIQNAALLRTGKVLLIPSSTSTLLWHPGATPAFTLLPGATTGLTADLFCSGHSFLSDGRLLAVGGGGGSPGAASSIQAWKFDPIAETWQQTVGTMAFGRWYPTVLTLGDEPGRVLVASGWMDGVPNTAPQMEVYSETTDLFSIVTVTGPAGEKVAPQTYPGLHLLPGGEIFYAPVGFGNCGQSADAYPATEPSGYFSFSGLNSGSWTNTGVNVRTKGMSALLLHPSYPFVRVLVVGGGPAATSATAQLINLSSLTPAWGPTFPLLEARVHPNVVLLPDGTVFICGGMEATGTPPHGGRCELYDPPGGTITEMDELNYPRHYHSVALLLPSGQVMAAGGASPGGCSLSAINTIEVFSPPYLFRGTRPTMAPLPALVHHGDDFEIATPDANDIARVVLVRPMAVTHQTDTEQRVVRLEFVQTAGDTLRATMPDGVHPHGLAPRGYYLLFILNAAGVPSVGQFLMLH